MMNQGAIIGVDLGGTRIRAARLTSRLTLEARAEIPTRAADGPDKIIQRMIGLIREVWPADGQISQIGVAAPGPLDPFTGVILSPPNLGWRNVPLRDMLHEAFGVPVMVGNDANAAALAEAMIGAGRGLRHMIYLTISTGVGSGIIVNGKLHTGARGLAAEAGLIPLLYGDRVATLEDLSAGPDMAREAVRRMDAGERSSLAMVSGELTAESIGAAAVAGDELANQVISNAGRNIGLGIVTLLHLFNPERVVIGGGVSQLGERIFDPIRATATKYVCDPAYIEGVDIVPAHFGGDVGLVGAGALVLTAGGTLDLEDAARML
jgi:glucokinase